MKNILLIGKAVHEILLDRDFTTYKKLSSKDRRSVDAMVIMSTIHHTTRIHDGDLVMDTRPLTFGKLYTIKSIKVGPLGQPYITMFQNGVTLVPGQFISRVN